MNDNDIEVNSVLNRNFTKEDCPVRKNGMQIAHLNIATLPGHFDEFISLMMDNDYDIMGPT